MRLVPCTPTRLSAVGRACDVHQVDVPMRRVAGQRRAWGRSQRIHRGAACDLRRSRSRRRDPDPRLMPCIGAAINLTRPAAQRWDAALPGRRRTFLLMTPEHPVRCDKVREILRSAAGNASARSCYSRTSSSHLWFCQALGFEGAVRGSVPVMRVPCPGVDSIVTRPPRGLTRSRMLRSPAPVAHASTSKPGPSSVTSNVSS